MDRQLERRQRKRADLLQWSHGILAMDRPVANAFVAERPRRFNGAMAF